MGFVGVVIYTWTFASFFVLASYAEAERHDPHEDVFLDTARDVLDALAPVIDRWPKYAWVAKQLLEPERVSVIDVISRGCFCFQPLCLSH